jgi:DHA1 family bicyclomycin/chloramphenicol resistance-like MFS transporter
MEPLGHVAGMASAVIGSITTLLAVVLSYLAGQAYDGTLFPLALAFVSLITVCVLVLRLAEA